MPTIIICPNCGNPLRKRYHPEDWDGKEYVCPSCLHEFYAKDVGKTPKEPDIIHTEPQKTVLPIEEITFELTNYCPEGCLYCSSYATTDKAIAIFLNMTVIESKLRETHYKIIHLSGGEPLAHPRFYEILQLCKQHADDVVVHTNALTHIAFNANIIDNIYLDAYVTLTSDVDRIHVVKRVKQGREKTRPEVHFSRNWTEDCACDHMVIRPNGDIVKTPCNKDTVVVKNDTKKEGKNDQV